MIRNLIWILLVTAVATPVDAASPRKLISQGNSAFRSGNYDEALSHYDEASVDSPEAAEIYFNKGTVYYKTEAWEEAIRAFEQAALKAKEPDFTADARYNMGNCSFRQAERQRDSDLQKAIDLCRTSIENYQDALKLNPDFKNAAENIEIVRLYIKNLLDEQKKQQEQQQQDQPQQNQDQQQQSDQQQQEDQESPDQQENKDQQQESESKSQDDDQQEDQGQNSAANQNSEEKQNPYPENQNEEENTQMQSTADTVRDILNEEKENQERRQPIRIGGGRPVDRDW